MQGIALKIIMIFFNIFTKREYKKDDDRGDYQTWYKVGFMKETENGGRFIRMFHQPETTYYLFPTDNVEKIPDIQIAEKP